MAGHALVNTAQFGPLACFAPVDLWLCWIHHVSWPDSTQHNREGGGNDWHRVPIRAVLSLMYLFPEVRHAH